jgi:hypothetical protein
MVLTQGRFKDGRRNLGYQRVSDEHDIITEHHPSLPITVKIVRSRKVAAHIQAPQMRAKEITGGPTFCSFFAFFDIL